jgi:hypothetical protein
MGWAMIDKKIFQTYKLPYEDLPNNVKLMIQIWKDKNPDYEYHYYCDEDIEKFIIQYYGDEWHKRYLSLPFPVMKADVFRILVIHTFGGFYSDLDAECREPLDTKNGPDVDSIVGLHSYWEFSHWFFGFKKGHPIMDLFVDSLAYNLDNYKFEDFSDPSFAVYQKHAINDMGQWGNQVVRYIMNVTGPEWWSEKIHDYFGFDGLRDYLEIERNLITNNFKKHLEDHKSIWLDSSETDKSDSGIIRHVFGSSDNSFYGNDYKSWADGH